MPNVPYRVLYWNLKNFTDKKFKPSLLESGNTLAEARKNYVLKAIGDPAPDVIVIVEVDGTSTTTINDGSLLSNETAKNGVKEILRSVRNKFGKNWCLIPPLNSGDGGKREAIAIIYNSNVLTFTGPDCWSTNEVPMTSKEIAADTNLLATYPTEWAEFLSVETVPTGALYNAGKNCNQLAGRVKFYSQGETGLERLYFPTSSSINPDAAPDRSPFLVTFSSKVQAGISLKIIALHFSPSNASKALLNLSFMTELWTDKENEFIIVVGDFNIDTFDQSNWEDGNNDPVGYCRIAAPHIATAYKLFPNPFRPTDQNHQVDFGRRPCSMTHYQVPSRDDGIVKPKLEIYATPYSASSPDGNAVENNKFGLANGTITGSNSVVRGYMGISMPANGRRWTKQGPARYTQHNKRIQKLVSHKVPVKNTSSIYKLTPSYTSAIDVFMVNCNNPKIDNLEKNVSVVVMNYVVGQMYANDVDNSQWINVGSAMFGQDVNLFINGVMAGTPASYEVDKTNGLNDLRTFNDACNFAHVQKTSDHLPLCLTLMVDTPAPSNQQGGGTGG